MKGKSGKCRVAWGTTAESFDPVVDAMRYLFPTEDQSQMSPGVSWFSVKCQRDFGFVQSESIHLCLQSGSSKGTQLSRDTDSISDVPTFKGLWLF